MYEVVCNVSEGVLLDVVMVSRKKCAGCFFSLFRAGNVLRLSAAFKPYAPVVVSMAPALQRRDEVMLSSARRVPLISTESAAGTAHTMLLQCAVKTLPDRAGREDTSPSEGGLHAIPICATPLEGFPEIQEHTSS